MFVLAEPADAPPIAALRNAVARHLTAAHGRGHWSSQVSERGVLFDMKRAKVYVARKGGDLAATFALSTRKPWAIDPAYFTKCRVPLYLTGMAVDPDRQRSGIGRACIDAARKIAAAWPADAIRLDAYDADAGAAPFYAKCGFREVGRVSYKSVPLVYFEMVL